MFIFDAPVGARVLSYGFVGVTILDDGPPLWWDGKTWTTDPAVNRGYSSNCGIRTFKAFKRHIRKHKKALEGRTVTLGSRYVGHNITWKSASS